MASSKTLDILLEVSGSQFRFHWIGLKKVVSKKVTQPCMCIISGPREGVGIPRTYIRQKEPNPDRVEAKIYIYLEMTKKNSG